jgi:hypothetical protein
MLTSPNSRSEPKKHRGRLLWVAITNPPILLLSIYMLRDVHRHEIQSAIDHPPAPPLWTVFYDNPYFTIALVLAGAGLLLEAINRREAGVINCGLWLALSIYSIAHSEPAVSTSLVVGLLAADVIWYALTAKRNAIPDVRG